MANLTITVDEETLKRARVRAIERGESVNQYLADQLRTYAGDQEAEQLRRQQQTVARMAEQADRIGADSAGWRWNRAEIYQDRLEQYDR